MKLCNIGWHKYKDIYCYKEETFLGKRIIQPVYSGFRICLNCNKIQQSSWDDWDDLDKIKSDVVMERYRLEISKLKRQG